MQQRSLQQVRERVLNLSALDLLTSSASVCRY